MEKKKCSRCKKFKPIENFNNCKNHSYGKSSYCRTCTKEYRIKFKEKYPWKFTYRYILTRCYNQRSDHYKQYGAKGIRNFLTIEDLKSLWFRDKAYLMKKPSIDRKDPKDNYTLDNCRYIEYSVNSSKSHLTYEERKQSSLNAIKKP